MINKKIKEIEFSGIRKMNALATENTINLGIGRPYCETPSFIKEAAINAINENKTYYTSNYGIKSLREAVSKRYTGGNFENSLVTIGAAEGIYVAMNTLLSGDDEVLIPNPGYLAYGPIGEIIGCKVKNYDLKKNFQLDLEDIKNKISEKTKMIIINNPGNPTGVFFKKSDLKELIKISEEKNIIILSDECYQKLDYCNENIPSIADFKLNDYIVVISSVSKEFSMTGFRVGWIYSSKKNIDEMVKLHLFINSCASSICQYGALAALESNNKEVVNLLSRNKKIMEEILPTIDNIKYEFTTTGLYYFIDVSYYSLDDKKIALELLKRKNVLAIPGSVFGSNGIGHLRLSFGQEPIQLRKGLEKIKKFFQNYERGVYEN